jgi:hypothetical protein
VSTSSTSSCSCGRYSSWRRPPDSPERGIEGLERLGAARQLLEVRAAGEAAPVHPFIDTLDIDESLGLERQRGAQQRHLELRALLPPAEQAGRHRERGEQAGGEVGERKSARAAWNAVARTRVREQQS